MIDNTHSAQNGDTLLGTTHPQDCDRQGTSWNLATKNPTAASATGPLKPSGMSCHHLLARINTADSNFSVDFWFHFKRAEESMSISDNREYLKLWFYRNYMWTRQKSSKQCGGKTQPNEVTETWLIVHVSIWRAGVKKLQTPIMHTKQLKQPEITQVWPGQVK